MADLQEGRHKGALDKRGQEGDDAHEEEGQRAVSAVGDLLVQQHEEGQRQPDCSSEPRPAQRGSHSNKFMLSALLGS